MRKYFGTDGIRGLANVHPLTADFARKLGTACGLMIKKEYKGEGKPLILLGKDTRLSGYLLEYALSTGFLTAGVDVVRLGVTPTPVVAYLTKHSTAIMGAVISASHNPFMDNGIKFFCESGMKLTDNQEIEIEKMIDDDIFIDFPTGPDLGRMYEGDSWIDKYVTDITDNLGSGFDISGKRIVMDCSNGAAYLVGPRVFREMGANLRVIANAPNGVNINKDCGSTNMKELQREVISSEADFGVAFDGDADRALFVDERGEIVDGDKVMALLAAWFNDTGRLKPSILVTTVMSNMGLFKAMENENIAVEQTKVGDRYVLERMLETGAKIGGEQSGHIILSDYNTTGDGILTAVILAKALTELDRPFSELTNIMTKYPQVLVNVRVTKEVKSEIMGYKEVSDALFEAEKYLGDTGRILVRPSGTEPLFRVMGEGEDLPMVEKAVNMIVDAIRARTDKVVSA